MEGKERQKRGARRKKDSSEERSRALQMIRQGERSYKVKLDAPIYDTVDDDDFIVGDDNDDDHRPCVGDDDNNDEEDIVIHEKKKKLKKAASGSGASPPSMKTIPSVFTRSAIKSKNCGGGGSLGSEVLEELIDECAPTEFDKLNRRRRRRRQSPSKMDFDLPTAVAVNPGNSNRTNILANSEEKVEEESNLVVNAKFNEKDFNIDRNNLVVNAEFKDNDNVVEEDFDIDDNNLVADAKFINNNNSNDNVVEEGICLNDNGSLSFYLIDAHEEVHRGNKRSLFLFGKVKNKNETYSSCCIVVKNLQRCVYAIPNPSVFPPHLVFALENDPNTIRSKLHEMASGLKREIADKLVYLKVSTFTMTPVKRNYAFDCSDVPYGESYVLKINYPFTDSPFASDLRGDNFSALLGTHSSALELFLVKRKIRGPSWLTMSNFSLCPKHQQVSWCKFEIVVDCPKAIKVSAPAPVMPPLFISAISLKTIVNDKNINEVVSASIVSCSNVKIDTPMVAWKNPALRSNWTVLRPIEGIFSEELRKNDMERRSKSGRTIVDFKSSERDLLSCLFTQISELDCDVLVGHNVSGFDLDVLLRRAKECGISDKKISELGRLKRSEVFISSKANSIKALGASSGIMSCIAGRLLCDTYLCSRELLKEVSYTLTDIAKSQLKKERKETVPQDDNIMKLLEYNETDAELCTELMFHLNVLPLTRQLTNLCGNLWGKTLQGGRAQRVEYLLLHEFNAKKYLVPDKRFSFEKEIKTKRKFILGVPDINEQDFKPNKKGPAYAGGLVLEPKRGLYDKIVLLLDFNSLYTSIIQEYNICFTTVGRFEEGSALRLPSCDKTGVLPELLKNLIERRARAKSYLKKATGLKAKQFDILQKALKLTSNSLYGCLGFSNFRFYAKPLAELITLQGREILQSNIDLVQNTLNLEVIYGDTDSIMINTGLDDPEEAKVMAQKVIKEVNKKYRFLEIDLDGMYKRLLLLRKKKYAAVKVQFANDKPNDTIVKGLDIVRRDWSLLATKIGENCLKQILGEGSCDDVVESIHDYLERKQKEIRNGEVALEQYVIRKTLTKPPEAYPDAKNQPHVQVALRRKACGYSTECSANDIIQYIICCEQEPNPGTSADIAQSARHPDELKKDNSKWIVDIDYYLSQQIHPVVARLCAVIQGTNPARLAKCLGLDASKFRSKPNDKSSNDSSNPLSCSIDKEERYRGCKPLILRCPSCLSTIECPIVWSCLSKIDNKVQPGELTSNFLQRLRCLKCPEDGNTGKISPELIANQVKRQADEFILMYYKNIMMCDDETCKYTTRSLNLRVMNDYDRGTVCPLYPSCNGHVIRKYTEADLYKQLFYFCHVLDTTFHVEKVDVSAKMLIQKDLARLQRIVASAAKIVYKLRDRCSYGWVKLDDLFVTSCCL